MTRTCHRIHQGAVLLVVASALATMPARIGGQAPPPQGPPQQTQPAQTPRSIAPIDLTGYWVSLVTDDWRWRMVTPPKGDVLYLPLNAEGRKAAQAWDPAKDEAAGEQCRGYGAAAVLRLPGRLHITWENDTTLKIETDTGTQTRVLHFEPIRPSADVSYVAAGSAVSPKAQQIEPSWQGYSVAQWEFDGVQRRRGPQTPPKFGSLKVVTTRMKPGYIRKNGVPYSGNAVLTEYFARISEPDGNEYLMVTNFLDDPQYLTGPYVRSVQFRRQKDATGWNPTPCSAR